MSPLLFAPCRGSRLTLSGLIRLFGCDERGAFALLFAVAGPVLILFSGLVIDQVQKQNLLQNIQSAADGAALTAASYLLASGFDPSDGLPSQELRNRADDEAERVVVVNGYEKAAVAMSYSEDGVTSRITVSYAPYFGFLGNEPTTLQAQAEATLPSGPNNPAEIALILDVGGSMAGTKMNRMKTGAKDLIAALIGENRDSRDKLFFALIPYFGTIALPSDDADSWIAPRTEADLPNAPADASNQSSDCPGFRAGQARNDDTPITEAKLRPFPVSTASFDLDALCNENARILPLTASKATLHAQIDAYTAKGGSALHTGISWAWRTLSPRWRSSTTSAGWGLGTRPLNYGDYGSRKYAILITDYPNHNLKAIGNVLLASQSEQANADESYRIMAQTCERMKNLGVTIFTIYIRNIAALKDRLENCASSEDHNFYGPRHLMEGVYAQIAAKIAARSVSLK